MTNIFLEILNMSISATWLVLVVILLRLILKRTPKWIHVLLWGLVAFRLLCPFTLESALSLIPSAEVVSPEIMLDTTPQIQTGVDSINAVVNPIITEPFAPTTPLASANPLQIWIPVAAMFWCFGMVLMLLYTLISYLRLRHQVRMAIRVKGNIYLSEFVSSPFVLGIFRPRIYLPYHMAEQDRTHVIAHERTHICRRDHWWKPLGFLLLTIHWFNPLMWLAYILLCRDIELACDERVIEKLQPSQRADYSQALLHCSVTHRTITACPIAFGEVGVKARVKNVLTYKKPAFWVIIVCLAIILIVSVCFLTDPVTENVGNLPITMSLEFVSRTRAHLIFQYSEELPDGEVQIPESYTLEHLVNGNWEALPRLREERDSAIVVEVDHADYDAWSLPDWSEDYGTLPDGTYRIKKEVTCAAESHSVYTQFTIGGTAEDYITLNLEDISPTGAILYEQESVEDTFDLIYDAGYWLETLQDGKWTYLEPTGYVEPIFENEKMYIHAYHSSGAIELDWSHLYGQLPSGTYRIAREVTYIGDSSPCVLTSHVEFTVGSDWGIEVFIDSLSENSVTVQFLTDENLPDGKYLYVGAFLQVKERIGSWTDVISIKESPKGKNIVTESPSINLLWQEKNYRLTEGNHRIALQIRHILPDGTTEYNTLYEYFDPSNYAWGRSINVTNISIEDGETILTYDKLGTYTLSEGSLTEDYLFDLQKRKNNQWIDMECKYDFSDRTDFPAHQAGKAGGSVSLSTYFGELPSGTYRLVQNYTRHYENGTTETRPIYAVFVLYDQSPSSPVAISLGDASVVKAQLLHNGEVIKTQTNAASLRQLSDMFRNAITAETPPEEVIFDLEVSLFLSDGSTLTAEASTQDDLFRIADQYYDYGPDDARETFFRHFGITWTDPEILQMIRSSVHNSLDNQDISKRILELIQASKSIDN